MLPAGRTLHSYAALGAAAALAAAAQQPPLPAAVFDAPGQHHAPACAPLLRPRAALRGADGRPTGASVGAHPGALDGGCPPGSVRLDLHEIIPAGRGALVFHNGGRRSRTASPRYGELSTADLGGPLPAPVPAGGGRGAPCQLAAAPAYRIRVRPIPRAMYYKPPSALRSGSNRGASYVHYGDPGAQRRGAAKLRYTYLLWSFLDVRGGGMVRTVLTPGQVVRACDVAPITMPAWSSRGRVDGGVTARYVQTTAGSCPVYGWIVWSHDFRHGRPRRVAHVARMRWNPPPAPGAAPGCPA